MQITDDVVRAWVWVCITQNIVQEGQPARPLTSTDSWKALAWSKAAWPMEPSITKMTWLGLTAAGAGRQPGKEG